MSSVSTPASTYRLQLHKDFTFDQAAAIAPYLSALGISHVYSSPYLQAAPGSMHGYDVVDHQRVNAELGGAEAHERFSRTLGENGLGQVLDIVPNHMAIGRENRFWWDVLENGSASRYASFFDIDWDVHEERLRNKVLVPILGEQYGLALRAGSVRVARSGPKFIVEAAGQTLPLSPNSLTVLLMPAADRADSDMLRFIADSFGRLPVPAFDDRGMILARHRDRRVLNRLLDRLCSENTGVCLAIDAEIDTLNADIDRLDNLLNAQNWRISYWKTADQQLGYRRFFDVNSLIGLRMDYEHVFEETHAMLVEWLARGVLDGIRVDHPDGLRDPAEYFSRLRKAAPQAWIVGEKILEPGEFLREDWPIEGTSGYDFLNVALGVLVQPAGLERLTELYASFTGQPTGFHAIAHDKKILVSQEALGSDVNRLTSLLVEICEKNRNQRDYTRTEARRAIRELAGCFPIYRTYVAPARGEITDEDRAIIHDAVRCAKSSRSDVPCGLFDFLACLLTLSITGPKESEFVLRFQQFTSPVMAKGVEDTAFYCFNRLIALCEVGGDPGRNGVSPEEFHRYQSTMQRTHPCTMTTLSTHDTKRSDDVRARLAVLSEIPDEFAAFLTRMAELTAAMKTPAQTGAMPDPNTEYLLYQTLLGAWPIDRERTKTYMSKAVRESKQQTSWVANNKPFEDALNSFIDQLYASPQVLAHMESFVARLLYPGRINSLAQTLLKHTAPGVPDLYQGAELWDLSLVDPDNRRPVDYPHRAELLKELPSLTEPEILARMDEGLPKLHLIHRALTLRHQQPAWFGAEAAYTPVAATGPAAPHALAYLRGEHVLTVVPLQTLTLDGNWADTAIDLPPGQWSNALTEEPHRSGRVLLADLFAAFPVALLTRDDLATQNNNDKELTHA